MIIADTGGEDGVHTRRGVGTIMGGADASSGNVYGRDDNVENPLQFTTNLMKPLMSCCRGQRSFMRLTRGTRGVHTSPRRGSNNIFRL
jgi:hypothetical protein